MKVRSLQFQAVALIIFLVVAPLVGLSFMLYRIQAKDASAKITLSNLNTLKQIGMNLDLVIKDVEQWSLFLYQSRAVRDYLEARDEGDVVAKSIALNDFIQSFLAYERHMTAITIRRLDGRRFVSNSDYSGTDDGKTAAILRQSGKLTFLGVEESNFRKGQYAYVFSRKLNDIDRMETALGTMELYIEEKTIRSLFSTIPFAARDLYLIAQDGRAIIASDEAFAGVAIASLFGPSPEPSGGNGVASATLDGAPMMAAYYRLQSVDWRLYHFVSRERLDRAYRTIGLYTLLALAVMLLGYGSFAYWLSARVLSRLKAIVVGMQELEKENFRVTVNERYDDELSVLAHRFNRMSGRLDELVNQVYASRIREKNSEIRALRAHINPHFLFNTLDTICWMSRMENADETCALVEALSNLFRISLQNERKSVSVAEELEYTRNYVRIQECRYSDSISFEFDVEPGLEGCETEQCVIQPLIENAIIHGLEPREGGGSIRISARRRAGRLVIAVENDGVDADIPELEEMLASYSEGRRGMAIYGVHSRIRLHYGAEYGLRFEPRSPRGLVAVVEQPYLPRSGR